jgi:predicted dehydrogenase
VVKVGIIGAGYIGEIHAECYKKIKNAELMAIVDVVDEKRIKLAAKYNVKSYSSTDDLLKYEDVECVDICVPSFLHSKIFKKVGEAGKHVFCEKPLALTLDDADEMIDVAKKNKIKAFVGHVLRFFPEYVKAKEIIKKGNLGRPLYGSFNRLFSIPSQDWADNEKYGGGVTLDLQIHDLDIMIWIFGKPNIVKSQGLYDKKTGGFNQVVTTVKFEEGGLGLAETGWAFSKGFPNMMGFRILCEKGVIEWLRRKNLEKNDLIVYKSNGSADVLNVEQIDAFLSECQYFIDCIDKNLEIKQSTFEDGRKALELALAAVKSAKSEK